MRLRYHFRFYPAREHDHTLACVFGTCRYVYNWGLRLRMDAYITGQPMDYDASSAALTALKQQPDKAWIYEISSVPPQQALRHLQTAFKNFFEKRAAYPKFKNKRSRQAAEYTRSAFTWDAEHRHLEVARLGCLDIHWSRAFTSSLTTVTIIKSSSGNYFVTLVLDEPHEPLPKTGQGVGVDVGLLALATLSNGERLPNPHSWDHYARQLARAQQRLSRRQPGSHRYERQRLRIAQLYEKLANVRDDYLHKFTTDLVRRFDDICLEDLLVSGMVRNPHVARSLMDARFGTLRQMLEYKCAWYGKRLHFAGRFFPSSKRCHVCGQTLEQLPLSVRPWTCPQCHTVHDRDENASKNIAAAGLAASARGETRRPARTSVRKGASRRSVNRPSTVGNLSA